MTSDKSRLYAAMRCIEEILKIKEMKVVTKIKRIRSIVRIAKEELMGRF